VLLKPARELRHIGGVSRQAHLRKFPSAPVMDRRASAANLARLSALPMAFKKHFRHGRDCGYALEYGAT
jgi:hypothetical protein